MTRRKNKVVSIDSVSRRKSRVPPIEDGKPRIRAKALAHSSTSNTIFCSEEESARYEALLAKLIDLWKPNAPVQHALVLQLRDVAWRLHSIPVLQINLATRAAEEHMDAYQHLNADPAIQRSAAQAAGYRANARLFEQLIRHEARLERRARQIEAQLGAARLGRKHLP